MVSLRFGICEAGSTSSHVRQLARLLGIHTFLSRRKRFEELEHKKLSDATAAASSRQQT